MQFRDITIDNLSLVTDLEVKSEQEKLVADNCYSIAQASLIPNAWCKVIYYEQNAIGFFSVINKTKELAYVWRFMIDAKYQGRGLGKRALLKLIEKLYSDGAKRIELAVSHDEGNAEEFYKKCGFISTDRQMQGEWILIHSESGMRVVGDN